MDMMATALDVLFRYTVNLLKLKRPRNWHTIKFTNMQFKRRADCMIGTRNILKIMGYTEPVYGEGGKQNGLNYPDPSQIVQDYIKLIGAELLIAKVEIRYAQENGIRLQQSYLPGPRNVQLENPNPIPDRPPFNVDETYTSNIYSQYVPQQFTSHCGSPPPSEQFPSQYGSIPPSEHSSVDDINGSKLEELSKLKELRKRKADIMKDYSGSCSTRSSSFQPQMAKIMMECDNCYFVNHEKSLECMDCGQPRNERWRNISMPSKPTKKPLP